ncbi:MAG TPA: hypothetical protein VI541_00035 [Actinomycetota bacterium]|nr:hypothetical protein [Actinomycetota bacterium]
MRQMRWRVATSMTLAVAIFAVTGASAMPEPIHAIGHLDDPLTPTESIIVASSGAEGLPLPWNAAALPSSSILFPGIRPGSWMIYPNYCTMNFIFNESGSLAGGGPYYIGTAKHCVQTQTGTDQFDASENVIGKHVVLGLSRKSGGAPQMVDIGTVAYATDGASSLGNDYALVRINSSLERIISPSISVIGGPTSVYSASGSDMILTSGHGLGLGSTGNGRPGQISAYNRYFPQGYGMILPVSFGDSGGPVRTINGAAVGNVTNIGVSDYFSPGIAFGTRVGITGRWGLKVVTCRTNDPWPLAGCP